jgi:hypothetical protein
MIFKFKATLNSYHFEYRVKLIGLRVKRTHNISITERIVDRDLLEVTRKPNDCIVYARNYRGVFFKCMCFTMLSVRQYIMKLVHWYEIFNASLIGWPLWNIYVTNDHWYVPLVQNTSRSFPHAWCITGFLATLTRRCH